MEGWTGPVGDLHLNAVIMRDLSLRCSRQYKKKRIHSQGEVILSLYYWHSAVVVVAMVEIHGAKVYCWANKE